MDIFEMIAQELEAGKTPDEAIKIVQKIRRAFCLPQRRNT